MNKVALLVPANIWFCPFVAIYTELLNSWDISYDIIYWDKSGEEEERDFTFKGKVGSNPIAKLRGYYKFGKFIKSILRKEKYSKVIVFSSQIGVFLSSYLKRHYNNRYIFDFRDLSIEQNKVFLMPFKQLLSNSFANVISSPGFKRWLPSGADYIISHNFNPSEVKKAIDSDSYCNNQFPLEVLTIGGIRDFQSNSSIISALSNKSNFSIRFVGRGPAAESLEKFAKSLNTLNIEFCGYYKKEEEPNYITSATFMNIYYPQTRLHSSSLSNRFYNSIIYRRPMIVTKGQIQGDYCEKYNLGVSISDTDNLDQKLLGWIKETDQVEYNNNCISLLKKFLEDYKIFRDTFFSFCNI